MEFISLKKDGRISISKAVVKKVNPLFDVEVSVQTKLLGDEQAMLEYFKQRLTKGTEGFFKLDSSKELTVLVAYNIPREGHRREAHRVAEEPRRDQAPQMLERGPGEGHAVGRFHRSDDDFDDAVRARWTEGPVDEIHHPGVEKIDSNIFFIMRRARKCVLYSNFDRLNG